MNERPYEKSAMDAWIDGAVTSSAANALTAYEEAEREVGYTIGTTDGFKAFLQGFIAATVVLSEMFDRQTLYGTEELGERMFIAYLSAVSIHEG